MRFGFRFLGQHLHGPPLAMADSSQIDCPFDILRGRLPQLLPLWRGYRIRLKLDRGNFSQLNGQSLHLCSS